jgi:hypothetical protein
LPVVGLGPDAIAEIVAVPNKCLNEYVLLQPLPAVDSGAAPSGVALKER